ncbi:MAG: alpha/beta fold hydrolase [Vicinamibacterales bacterium]
MARALADGIATHYEVVGDGAPLLMFSPGGFDATADKWRTQGIYARIKPLDHLSQRFSCITFDRRECGESDGRIEPVTWAKYAAQGKGLLDHLRITRAHVMGACMGCGPALALAVACPELVASLVLYWPVGGPKYRINGQRRFGDHVAFVEQQGLSGVVALARESDTAFGQDPRRGPWAPVIRRDHAFADAFAAQNPAGYLAIVRTMADGLFDRDTAPGAEPEALMTVHSPALIVPGHDATHATSAARYLEECLPRSQYWDIPVADQTESCVSPRLVSFLEDVTP